MAHNTSGKQEIAEVGKEFVVFSGILMVRIWGMEECFSPDGKQMGSHSAVTMRPASREEITEYQEQQCQKQPRNQP